MAFNQMLGVSIIDFLASVANDVSSEANSLGSSIDLCIKQYEGLQI
jgi:hypothetical protein